MSDLMWGGVPFQLPSSTAIKYLGKAVKVKRECDIEDGARYNARQTMEKEVIGHRQSRKDMLDSYEDQYQMKRRARMEPRPYTCSGVSVSRLSGGDEYQPPMDTIYYHEKACCFRPTLTRCPMCKITKPKIGWTEPRAESFLGMVDCRLRLPGYVGGKRVRENI